MSYPPQQGYQGYPPPQYGYPQPGYGYYPPRPTTWLAYVTAALFLACAGVTFVYAFISWDGTSDTPEALVSTVGFAFTGDITRNTDFAVTTSMIVAGTTTLFALIMLARLQFVRWILIVIGGLVTAYYIYGMIWLLTKDLGDYIGLEIATLMLWLAATITAVLPATGRGMRRPAMRPQYQSGYQY